MKIDPDIFNAIKECVDNLVTCKLACDGILLAKVDKYNQLVALINLVEANSEKSIVDKTKDQILEDFDRLIEAKVYEVAVIDMLNDMIDELISNKIIKYVGVSNENK